LAFGWRTCECHRLLLARPGSGTIVPFTRIARISPEIGDAWLLAPAWLKKRVSAWWLSTTVGVPERSDPKVAWSAEAAAGSRRRAVSAAQIEKRMIR
jgi:hypothetical protein